MSAGPAVRRGLQDAAPRPFWLDRPERPDPLPPLAGAALTPTCSWSAAATPGCGPHCWPSRRMPGRDVLLVDAGTCGWAASGRNGGFCAASLTHGLPTASTGSPTRSAMLETPRPGQPRRHRPPPSRQVRHRLRLRAHRRAEPSPSSRTSSRTGRRRRAGPRSRPPSRLLDRDEVRAEVDSPTYLGGLCDARPGRHGRPGAAGLGAAPRLPRRSAYGCYEHTRVTGLRADGAAPHWHRRRHRRAGIGARPTRRSGACAGTNVFPPLLRRLRSYLVPVYDYALMTGPLTRGRARRIGWRNRQGLGRHRQPVPLLPDHRRRPDPLRRLRRRLPLRQPDRARAGAATGHLRRRWPRTSSPRSRSWHGRAVHATAGEASSTRAPGSARSSAPPTAAGWRTRPATPGSASAPPASAPGCCSTCSTAGTPR